ncbi:MAG: cytochrome c3 family protein [Candidatus Omnitrophica bacterium]|nr:cytochrome c3 family protein [Candidatus Omnitrophota bacterium]
MRCIAPISARISVVAAFLLLLFVGVQKFVWAVEAPKNNSCVTCHMDIWEETKDSIHSSEGITCNNCHGGDPAKKEKELAKAPATGYIGIPDKKQIVNMCGTCHANVEVMNFYGIRTDQLARYKTSMHGKKLLIDGDTHVAACADCHGYHNILGIGDPQSSVYPTNVPKTCNKCHGNEKLMGRYHLPSDIFKQYENSAHGVALLVKNDLSSANCVSCHGSHGAMPPGVKEVSDTCGKCHINEKKFFLTSEHAKLAEGSKFSECISCHGFHGIQHPTIQLFSTACSKCHNVKSLAAQRALSMQ